jgi:hypothetical protein
MGVGIKKAGFGLARRDRSSGSWYLSWCSCGRKQNMIKSS